MDGKYFGIRDHWDEIQAYARGQLSRDGAGDQVKVHSESLDANGRRLELRGDDHRRGRGSDVHGDLTAELLVTSLVDGSHPASPEAFDDSILADRPANHDGLGALWCLFACWVMEINDLSYGDLQE